MKWQKIGTAPRDNTSVPVAVGAIVGEAYWHDGSGSDEGWWWAGEGPGDYHAEAVAARHGEPTHWMPLPPAPKASAA